MERIEKAFEKIGARARVARGVYDQWGRDILPAGITVDVRRDAQRREFFDIRAAIAAQPEIVDVRPGQRHLVLMVRDQDKAKYLCGHDERHWFCAAVPGRSVSTVEAAIRSLRPAEAWVEGVIRQGEWFFRPLGAREAQQAIGSKAYIRRYEPISRGGGSKPHICREVVRLGGTPVMVCGRYPSGIPSEEYDELLLRNPEAVGWGWRAFTVNARVFARGTVRHADHATVHLWDWHEVYLNNERLAAHARSVVFLD